MRRPAAFVLVIVVVGLTATLAWKAFDIAAVQRRYNEHRATLISASLADEFGKPSHLSSSEGPSLLAFFTTTCDYCSVEIASLLDAADRLTGVAVYLISTEEEETLQMFSRRSNLASFPQFKILRDSIGLLPSHYGIKSVPTILVYDGRGRLVEVFQGLTPIERIVASVREAQ